MRASESVLHSPCNDKAHKDERVRVVACRCRGGARRESEIESERRSEKTRMKRERRAKCIRRGKGDKEEKGKRRERETNCYILPSCRRGSVLRDFLCREVCVSCSEGAGGGQGWNVRDVRYMRCSRMFRRRELGASSARARREPRRELMDRCCCCSWSCSQLQMILNHLVRRHAAGASGGEVMLHDTNYVLGVCGCVL
jgi:hypothetical protein